MIDTDTRKKESRFKKIILHVGPDKTGSTSIQFSLNRSRDLLLNNGVFYPPCPPCRINHGVLGSYFTSESNLLEYNDNDNLDEHELIVARDRAYLRTIENSFCETQADTLVLSYEGFVHLTEDALKKMKQFLEKYCDVFEIVFYVRAPLSYAISSMSQHVKTARRACKDHGDVSIVNYKVLLGKLCRCFGKDRINVRLFSKDSLPNGNVILDFLSLLNLSTIIEKKVVANGRNRSFSLSHEALLIGDKMIELLDGYLSPFEFNHERHIGSVFLPAIKGRKILLTDFQREEILKQTAPHVEYLYKEFGITMNKEPRAMYKPLRISEDTINFTANELLRVLVPDFKQPIQDSDRDERKLNRLFILRVMLTVKVLKYMLAGYRRLRSGILTLR